MRAPKIRMKRHGSVFGVQTFGRGIKETESLARNAGQDLGSHSAPWPCFTHGE